MFICSFPGHQTGRGGQVILFHTSLPDIGPGAVGPRVEESSYYDSDKERELFTSRHPFWNELAEECADEGVGISLVLAPHKFADIGSLGMFCQCILREWKYC